jgi:hypothetical protein
VAHANNGDTIDIVTPGTIALTKGQLVLSHDMAIQGVGKQAVISGSGLSRVFDVTPNAHVRLANLELINGNGRAGFAGVVFPFDGDGGAILNQGWLAVVGCTLTADHAKDGGAIYNAHGMTSIIGSTLFRDIATHEGGAVYNDHGSLAISHSTLSYDSAGADGGAISNSAGRVTLSADILSHDSAKLLGGAICSEAGLLVVANSTLSYDAAGVFGGGIFTNGDQALLTGDLLTHDSAGVHGGGIYHTPFGTLKISFSTASADSPDAHFGPYVSGPGNVGF